MKMRRRGRARARAPENRDAKIAENREGTSESEAATNADLPVHAHAKPLKSPSFEANEIQEVWEYETGYFLHGSTAFELEQLASEDYELVKKAIIKAEQSKTTERVRYVYFKKVYEDMKNSHSSVNVKGGEKNEKKSRKQSEADFLGYNFND